MKDKFCIVIGGRVSTSICVDRTGDKGFYHEHDNLPPELLYFGKDFGRAHKVLLESSVYYNTRLLASHEFVPPLDNEGNVRSEVLEYFIDTPLYGDTNIVEFHLAKNT